MRKTDITGLVIIAATFAAVVIAPHSFAQDEGRPKIDASSDHGRRKPPAMKTRSPGSGTVDALAASWRQAEAGILANHVQLTFADRFYKAGEPYFSPDGNRIRHDLNKT